ncbi:DISARM system phospholipase D-like protein DrmC [Streptomyces sp. NPDC018610]|uniref:DISARM system phospholipase D-like protein DrmC n=1 Tax=Streptomyces sp. NPDC018610 TaxID=3365049 RepID=UPI0037A147CB
MRATAQVLVEVIDQARDELLAMTYAARPYPALTRALTEATARGVRTHVVVETLAGARGLLCGREPAEAFASVPGVRLWHWAREGAAHVRSRQHAKLAVADRRTLFLGSANLTESVSRRNIEAGVLVRGGEAPRRAAEHVVELQRLGILRPMA